MNKYWLILFLGMFSFQVNSQTSNNFCMAGEWTRDYSITPEFKRQMSLIREDILNNMNRISLSAGDSIPVVVHVVWSTPAMNIPDSLINQQIQILNDDFARLNADTVNTPAAFKPLAGSTPFRFVLARRDPNGAFTTGIVRQQTSHGPFTGFYELSSTARGGDDAWNSSYLNIYCCELASPAAGVAMLNFSRVAIGYGYWGINGATGTPNRVGTHEVGHCFGLEHIWGSETTIPYSCASDDGIADTPPQFMPSGGCPSFPLFDQCTPAADGIMFSDYMDYSSGTCQNMFSIGQATAMINNVNLNQPTLLSSNGDVPVKQIDAGISNIYSPTGNSCITFNPKVLLRNWGTDILTSVTIKYQVDTFPIVSYSWTGNLSNYEADTLILPSFTITNGILHRLKAYAVLPNNVIDQDASNDTSRVVFVAQPTVNTPMFEGFEGTSFPLNWGAYNPDGDNGFMRSITIGHTGTASLYIDNGYNISNHGHFDDINIKVNLFNTIQPYLSFYVANTTSAPLGVSDTLEVYASTDCGLSYNLLYRKFDTLLYTAPVIPFGSVFIPTASQWRKDSINLSLFSTIAGDVLIRFRDISGYGLELYIDDVRINNTVTGIEELGASENFLLFPNPNKGNFHLQTIENIHSIMITNFIGQLVYAQDFLNSNSLDINLPLRQGSYLLSAKTNSGTVYKKIVVD